MPVLASIDGREANIDRVAERVEDDEIGRRALGRWPPAFRSKSSRDWASPIVDPVGVMREGRPMSTPSCVFDAACSR